MIQNKVMDSRTTDRWSNEMIEKFVREMNMMMLSVYKPQRDQTPIPAMYDALSTGQKLKLDLKDVIDTRFEYRDTSHHSRKAYLSKPFVLPDLEMRNANGGSQSK